MSAASSADHELAHELATEAGRILVELRADLTSRGIDGRELKDAGDLAAHEFLCAELAARRPDDAVLSEEGVEDEGPEGLARRRAASRVWIVDPLDGTREFSEVPRTDWAVHVALAIDGAPVCGAVALPALDVTLSTLEPPTVPDRPDVPRVAVSRTRPPAEAGLVTDALGATLVPMGSAGAKAMSILRGETDIYPHSGGQYEWDSCAPVAVATAAGLWCSRLDGTPLTYGHDNPWLPDLLICRPTDAPEVLRAINGT